MQSRSSLKRRLLPNRPRWLLNSATLVINAINLNSPSENEIPCLKGLVELLRGNRTELYIMPASFQKASILNEGNLAFSGAFTNIEPRA